MLHLFFGFSCIEYEIEFYLYINNATLFTQLESYIFLCDHKLQSMFCFTYHNVWTIVRVMSSTDIKNGHSQVIAFFTDCLCMELHIATIARILMTNSWCIQMLHIL